MASGSGDSTARLWDPKSGQCLAIVEEFQEVIRTIAWSSLGNSAYFVTGCGGGSVRVWNAIRGEDGLQVRLHGPSNHDRSSLSNVTLQNVKGLSLKNQNLFGRYWNLQHELQREGKQLQSDDKGEEGTSQNGPTPIEFYVNVEDPDDADVLYDIGLMFER